MAVGTCVAVAVVSVTLTWGCYRFRYAPSPVPGVGIDMPAVLAEVHRNAASAALGRLATPAEVSAYPVDGLNRFVAAADARRLLPQAYLAGLAYQSANVLNWPAYLNGVVYFDGRAAYFPLAWLYKTPVAEIAASPSPGLSAALPYGRRRGTVGPSLASPSQPPCLGWQPCEPT